MRADPENKNLPAFACVNQDYIQEGLSKREYFTAEMAKTLPPPADYFGKKETKESYSDWAKRCVKMADALLEELS